MLRRVWFFPPIISGSFGGKGVERRGGGEGGGALRRALVGLCDHVFAGRLQRVVG